MAEPRIPDVSLMNPTFDGSLFLEKRMENDANGNPIYVGLARPGTATSAALWFITKQTYDGNNSVTHQQFPSDIPGFAYVWDDRASLTYS
jgi:hypothetical protein